MMRRRGPGLVRTVARTAVVAGTASAVAGNVHHRQAQRWEAQAQEEAAQQQQAADAAAFQQQMAQQQAMQTLDKMKALDVLRTEIGILVRGRAIARRVESGTHNPASLTTCLTRPVFRF